MSKKKIVYFTGKCLKKAHRFLPVFLDNCRVFLFQKKPYKGPLGIVWNITGTCNLGCIFCDWWRVGKEDSFPRKKEPDTRGKLEIVKKVAEAGTEVLSFCGGEPLLCRDLELLIREAKRKGMIVNISTNGLLLEEKAKMLIDSGVDSMTLSIDSHDPEIHDMIRGHKGLYDRIEKGVEAVRNFSGGRRIYIEARYLINRMNCFALEEFVNLWGRRVDAITFIPVYENPNVLYRVPSRMRFRPEDEGRFRAYFHDFLKRHKDLDNPYHRWIPDFLFRPERLKEKFLCFAGTFFGSIDCEGNLYPCQELTALPAGPLGNLLKKDFMDLWDSEEVKKLRKLFKRGLRCNCWVDRFIPNIYLQRFLGPLDKILNISGHDKTKKTQVL